jgi:hypothetical protein
MMIDVKRLEVPDPLVRLGKAFREEGHELFLVGGYVRDTLLARTSADAHRKPDAATDAHPREIKRILRPHAEHLWAIGERFGTIVATLAVVGTLNSVPEDTTSGVALALRRSGEQLSGLVQGLTDDA